MTAGQARGAKGGAENARRQHVARRQQWVAKHPAIDPDILEDAYRQGYEAGKQKRLREERNATS